ncbi:MAG: Spy/CpxP family protein refolding chaperone [Desulfomonile tiedjei]|uniref:Spy/CpxP family protein refolding chaperone n=1 Tax=Desulfomonile tiedjei TaxID=2358 RepID=A0A9D6V2H6_9BACT|nr:Spy/CpxP family protein refolding chaperone [Desulfomonile tiedjei]
MDKRAFLVLPLAALLTIGAFIDTSAAQEKGVPSGSSAVQAAGAMPAEAPEHLAGPGHHRPGLEAMMKKLGITDEQKKQLRSLYVGFRDKTRKARTELMALRDEKKTMMLSGKIDQQKLAQIDDQEVKLQGEVMKEKLKLKRDRLTLLTPDQLDRMADFQAERSFHAKMMKRHHPGPMHGQSGPHGEID